MMSNNDEKTSKNMSEFQEKLDGARKYVADSSGENVQDFKWILNKAIPKISEVLEDVYATADVKLKGIANKADAAKRSFEVLADTIIDASVNESNFDAKLVENLKKFYTSKIVESKPKETKEESDAEVGDADADAEVGGVDADAEPEQISPLELIRSAREMAVLLKQFESGDYDELLNADTSAMDEPDKKHAEQAKRVKDYVYGDGKKLIDEIADKYADALFPSFKASVAVMDDDGKPVSDSDIKDIIKKSVVSTLAVIPRNSERAFDAAVIGDVSKAIKDNYPNSQFLINGDPTLLTRYLEGDPKSKQQRIVPSKKQREDMYANAEEFIKNNSPVLRVAYAGELLGAFLATIHGVANKILESYSTSEKNRDFLESHSIDKDDLIQIGIAQYLKALQLYDPNFVNSKGQKAKFNTYLTRFLTQSFMNVISGAKTQQRSQTVKDNGKIKHVPLQRLDAPVSTGDEDDERGLGSTLTGDEGADISMMMEQDEIRHSALVTKAREFLHELISSTGIPAHNASLIEKLFDAEVESGFKGINFTKFAKTHGLGTGTPTVWEGKYIIPAILFVAGKITKEDALRYSRSSEGVHKKLHNIMKSDYYAKDAVVSNAPYFTVEDPKDPNNNKYIQTATSEVVGYSPEELAAKLPMINHRIDEVNELFGHAIEKVKTSADIVKAVKAHPKTMFGIIKSVEHRPTPADINSLTNAKVGSTGALKTHTSKLVTNLYDLLCGFSDRDMAANVKALLTLTTPGTGKNAGNIVPMLSKRAKDVLSALAKNSFNLNALKKVGANDMEINETLRELNRAAYDYKVGMDMQMSEVMSEAADVFLNASETEVRAAKAKIIKSKNPTLKKIFAVMDELNFSTDSIVVLSMHGIPVSEILDTVQRQIIPLIKAPNRDVDMSPNVLDKPIPGEVVKDVKIKERPSLERQLDRLDKENG
jgi:hypothetical protein